MQYLKIIDDRTVNGMQFNQSLLNTPSAAFSWVGVKDKRGTRLAIKFGSQNLKEIVQNEAKVTTASVSTPSSGNGTIGIDFDRGDIFTPQTALTSGKNYNVTVSHLGSERNLGRSLVLYIDVPANTKLIFGTNDSEIIDTNSGTDFDAGKYCIVFANLYGNSQIDCVSIWKAPNVTGTSGE